MVVAVDPLMPRDYPRVCGGTVWAMAIPAIVGGLSPRVRGNRRVLRLSA